MKISRAAVFSALFLSTIAAQADVTTEAGNTPELGKGVNKSSIQSTGGAELNVTAVNTDNPTELGKGAEKSAVDIEPSNEIVELPTDPVVDLGKGPNRPAN